MPRPINEEKLVAKMTKAFIIPNWYKPENFVESEDWDKAKVERFKQYFAESLSAYDPFIEMISDYMQEFEEYEEYHDTNNDEDEDEDEQIEKEYQEEMAQIEKEYQEEMAQIEKEYQEEMAQIEKESEDYNESPPEPDLL